MLTFAARTEGNILTGKSGYAAMTRSATDAMEKIVNLGWRKVNFLRGMPVGFKTAGNLLGGDIQVPQMTMEEGRVYYNGIRNFRH